MTEDQFDYLQNKDRPYSTALFALTTWIICAVQGLAYRLRRMIGRS